ncbi:HAMP domain-containing sensor histidine kinase [Staphylococcus canis]|uniref:Heme sensor protein HssS n=1 Tax=Staphylococcus canis TaxID=2724942 RepID=A0ABS0T6D4_9STAP|nr:HAMP domain-containing sensor histidine kinase [Staphylococcus canis]MBI5974306.1 HAMP domain-containing histidine kinase [Staphylococcus canis]
MFKTLYSRFAIYTITVMLISAILSFLMTNIYYHFELKSHNDAKVMQTLQQAKAYQENEHQNFNQYMHLLGDLNFQIVVYDEAYHASHYGHPFRKHNLSRTAIARVLSGEDYHGIQNRPFNPVITGFFDNETRNTVGTLFETQHGRYAVFMRPDIGHAFGEFRIFLVVLLTLLIIISIALVIWSTFALVKPVQQLKLATSRMMEGDFNTPIAVTRNDEIGALQQHFDTMRIKLKQLDDMRQHFVQNVSHEMKTPLTHIHHLLTQLQNEKTPSQQSQYIERIYDETHRLSQLTRQLLLLSELDNDAHLKFDDKLELKGVIQDILQKEAYALDQKEQVVVYELKPIQYMGNERLLTQAIENIIRNAIKYTEPYGMIDIHLYDNQDTIVIAIQDDGPGMSPETLHHIFDRFYKNNAHTDSNGLGLAISKSIIERHHGTIEVESTLGEGTLFKIILPKASEI